MLWTAFFIGVVIGVLGFGFGIALACRKGGQTEFKWGRRWYRVQRRKRNAGGPSGG